MSENAKAILFDPVVLLALAQAWIDSQPGLTGGHEEGGFVLRGPDGKLNVVRWSRGSKNTIILPAHPNCKFDNQDIVASFHIHPNTGPDHLQEPSETDKVGVSNDPDLQGAAYVGEFVIAARTIFLISPDGSVSELGDTATLLGITGGKL